MLCTATLAFIAISLAYFIVSIAGYNNLPGSLFLVGTVIVGFFIQLACSFIGEVFGWGAMVLMGVIVYIYMMKDQKPSPARPCNRPCDCPKKRCDCIGPCDCPKPTPPPICN